MKSSLKSSFLFSVLCVFKSSPTGGKPVQSGNSASATDLLVAFSGHPSSGEGLDGDGGHLDDMVDLSHAVTSPVSLDHHSSPALLQYFSGHRFTESLTNDWLVLQCSAAAKLCVPCRALTGSSSSLGCTAGGWWPPLVSSGISSCGSIHGRVSESSRRLLSVDPDAASPDKLPVQRERRSLYGQTCTGWGPGDEDKRWSNKGLSD